MLLDVLAQDRGGGIADGLGEVGAGRRALGAPAVPHEIRELLPNRREGTPLRLFTSREISHRKRMLTRCKCSAPP